MSASCDLATTPIHIVLERIDASKNMARYYVLSVEPTLFGDSALRRTWGRIGAGGRQRSKFFDDGGGARVALDTWLARKRKRGYVVRIRANLERF